MSTTIGLSSPTCSVRGDRKFTVTYSYKNVGTKPIRALVRVWSDFCNGFEARDLHTRRCRGLPPTRLGEDFDEEAIDLEDTELINLAPGQTTSRSYMFSTGEKLRGYIHSDMYKLEVGKKYALGLRPRRWRWTFADNLPADIEGQSGLISK